MLTYKIIYTILTALHLLLIENIDSYEKEKLKNDIESMLDNYKDIDSID